LNERTRATSSILVLWNRHHFGQQPQNPLLASINKQKQVRYISYRVTNTLPLPLPLTNIEIDLDEIASSFLFEYYNDHIS
jgi:hypothetical protein